MNYASVCDGIGAAHVAWEPLGWACQWTSEIEPFPAAVVEHHYGFRNLGDMTAITEEMLDAPVELLVGGTPCQSFSVAGLRGGLADPRGNLALRFIQLAAVMQPEWIIWENVPGVLSSGKGRDFGTFLGGLAELGYGFAYRVLDAQWFGVAQRRRRVFVVGHLGDWRRAAAVLFERESVFGNPPTRGKAWQDAAGSTGDGVARCVTTGESRRQDWETCNIVAGTLNASGKAAGSATQQDAEQGLLVAFHPTQDPISSTDGSTHSMGCGSKQGCCTQAVAVRTANTSANGHGLAQEVSHTIDQVHGQAVAFKPSHYTRGKDGAPSAVTAPLSADADKGDQDTLVAFRDPSPTVTAKMQGSSGWAPYDEDQHLVGVGPSMAVRRLTPRECERLQGFPDDYTLVTYRNKPAADGPRYKALGNSMAVPVMRWIGQRIAQLRRPAAEPLRQG